MPLSHFNDTKSESDIKELGHFYHDDVNSSQLIVEYNNFHLLFSNWFEGSNDVPKKLPELLTFVTANDLNQAFPNVCTLLGIFATIPVSSASAERSFSRLKLIKSYLRSTMSEQWLSGLSLLSIERELAGTFDFSKVIDTFANMSVRRKKL